MNMNHVLLKEALPELAEELMQLLKKEGEEDLAAQVPELSIFDRCRCGDFFCSSIYTAPPPSGTYGPGHENIPLEPDQGWIVLDLVNRKIAHIEILDRDNIRQKVLSILP